MSQIQEVELGIEEAKAMIARAESLKKLFKNKDFKDVVTKGYLEEEAIRLVLLKADPATLNEDMQAHIDKGITAIGQLNQYFKSVQALGTMAARSLQEYEELHAELLAEGE